MKRNIFWILGGAAALYLISRLSFAKKANFILESVKPSGYLIQPTLTITFKVQNPTNQKIKVRSIVGNIEVNGKFLSYVSSFGFQTIEANSESTLIIKTTPTVIGVFNTIREIFTQPIKNLKFRFTGNANVDGVVIPIEQTLNL